MWEHFSLGTFHIFMTLLLSLYESEAKLILVEMLVMMVGRLTVPKPVSVVGTQITSSKREITLMAVVIAFPYLAWKGSSMVMHRLSLMGSTKTKPPTLREEETPQAELHCSNALDFSRSFSSSPFLWRQMLSEAQSYPQ